MTTTRILALFNQSGGVGKTSLTMNLGYHLAQRKKNRVLLVDMDPQASLTTFMGLDPDSLNKTVYCWRRRFTHISRTDSQYGTGAC